MQQLKTPEKKTFDNVPEADIVVNYISSRFKKGLGTTIYIIGLSGTGKSSSSQRIGELLIETRPEENLKMFIVDSLLELIEAIQQSKQGDIIIIEEVSVLFPSRRAMGSENLAIGKILDTIRKKRLCLISNAPIWTSIDKHMRSMGHVLIQTLNILKGQEVVISKFYRLQTNPASGKTYTHTMTRKGKDVQLMITRMPNTDRWSKYESKKDAFMDELYQDLKHKQIKKKEKKDKEMGRSIPKPKIKELTPKELQVHQLYNIEGLKQREIAEKFGFNRSRVSHILKNIAKKSNLLTNNG